MCLVNGKGQEVRGGEWGKGRKRNNNRMWDKVKEVKKRYEVKWGEKRKKEGRVQEKVEWRKEEGRVQSLNTRITPFMSVLIFQYFIVISILLDLEKQQRWKLVGFRLGIAQHISQKEIGKKERQWKAKGGFLVYCSFIFWGYFFFQYLNSFSVHLSLHL